MINRAFVYKKDEMNGKELTMLIMPSLVGVTGYGVLQYYLNIYEKDTGKNLIDSYGFYGAAWETKVRHASFFAFP